MALRAVRSVRTLAFLLALSTIVGARVRAQQPVADRSTASAADTVLALPVTVSLENVPLRNALAAIAASAGVRVQYQFPLVAANDRRVTLHATKLPLGTAFQRVLSDTRLTIGPISNTLVTIVGIDRQNAPQGGSLGGVITNAKTQQPLQGVVIVLDDSAKHSVVTSADGRYRFAEVRPGTHTVRVRAVGFVRQMRAVVVHDDSGTTANFSLDAAVNPLDQVVVTATGPQQYRELGHVVAKINADSLVKHAPITTLSELLTGRVPGLQVITAGGTVGGEVALRIRSQTTTSLDPQPVIIVDGVRYKNTNTVQDNNGSGNLVEDRRPFGVEGRSPLNDINVNDIETIEVVKGPSASTLYGPDAANGVIVITTKRGKVGKPEWHVYAHPSLRSSVPESRLARGWQAWGHDPATNQTVPFNCTVLNQYYYKDCVLDSITVAHTSPTDGDVTMLAPNRLQGQMGTSVTGGSGIFTYFLSGNYDSQLSSIKIPARTIQLLQQQHSPVAINSALKNPNSQQSVDVHSNLSADVSEKTTVSLTTTYSQSQQRGVDAGIFSALYGSRLPPGVSGADSLAFINQHSGISAFVGTSLMQSRRVEGALQGNFRPLPWLVGNALVGTDIGVSTDFGVAPRGSLSSGFGGQAGDYRRNNIGRTMTLGLTATSTPGLLSFKSSLGLQYQYSHLDGVSTDGYNLAPASTSINTATLIFSNQLWGETVTLGTYGEEVIGLNNVLFLTGSLRIDGATSYGDSYHPRPYPKVGMSWVASDEPFFRAIRGLDELRFRASYGAASRAPTSTMKIGSVLSSQVQIEGTNQNVYSRVALANPFLRPERTHEFEYGVDATLFEGIVQTGVTAYRRRTDDELQVLQLVTGFPGAQWANVGDVSAHGVEATANLNLVRTRLVGFNLGFSYVYQTNKLLSLGAAQNTFSQYGGYAVGYPLGAVFGRAVIGVADTVGGVKDGIIFPEEVTLSPIEYRGVLTPPHTYTWSPNLTLFQGRIRISTLFDRATGFVQQNPYSGAACRDNGLCVGAFLTSTPALEQARYAVANFEFEPGDFTRWRELSISADLPSRMMRLVRLKHGEVSVMCRNLALWTAFHGPDPESQPGAGLLPAGGSVGAIGIPNPRVWSFQFHVTP